MPSSSSQNGSRPMSAAALLLDPKAFQRQIASHGKPGRATPGTPPGRSTMRANGVGAPLGSTTTDPQQLLNPRGRQPKNSSLQSSSRVSSRSSSSSLIPGAPSTHDRSGSVTIDETGSALEDSTDSDRSGKKRGFAAFRDSEGAGHGTLIENMYGVERRGQQPQKRYRRIEDERPASAPHQSFAFSGPGNTGLGEFMKDGLNSKEGTPSTAVAAGLIDLTTSDQETIGAGSTAAEDDDIVILSESNVGSQTVCYGKIEGATVQAFKVPTVPQGLLLTPSQWPSVKCELRREPARDTKIEVLDPTGTVFGNIDPATATALAPLLDSPVTKVRPAARLDVRKRKEDEIPGQACSDSFRISINLYGPKMNAISIGRHMGQKNVWLGIPNSVEAGISTFNPHAERRAARPTYGPSSTPRTQLSGPVEVRTLEEVNDAAMKMFDHLKSADNLPEKEPEPSILTPLLRHQKQALWFMTEKEKPRMFGPKEEDNNSLWRVGYTPNGQRFYREIVSGLTLCEEPPQVYGGLLADMMGLGKTLSILSLVVSSLPESQIWENMEPAPEVVSENPDIRNAKTTLLVCPLSAVGNWVTQEKEHLKAGTLSSYVFHGPSRTTSAEELSRYDLVITTYTTVLSDLSGKSAKRGVSPLTKMNMFRIVLDEAHAIREQNAAQTQAIFRLNAQRRWSVTGTPIQNRLEDLAAVTKFLKLYPFDEKPRFASHIMQPFKSEDPGVLARLRVFVDSFTLRRVKDRINLPPRHDQVIILPFSEEEKSLHEFFRRESNVMMNVIAGETKQKMGGRMYHHVLKAMMILRQISAHGKELLDQDDRERIKGMSAQDAIDLEEGGGDRFGAADRKAYEMFALMKDSAADVCVKCGETIEERRVEDGAADKNTPIAFMLTCYDVLCKDCFAPLEPLLARYSSTDTKIKCAFCEGAISAAFTAITTAGFEKYLESQVQSKQNRKNAKTLGIYEGPHTKTKALVAQLLKNVEESQHLPGEAPIKSVVFSAWTSHLDLIEIAMKDNGITGFTRLDGTMTRKARDRALDSFREDNNITVLLATIGAGGVGLNLTSGSKVYVMEPQYNPAAVAQAVDRVHRLGQTREVTTVQFIMKDSIEEKIAELARKKQRLADLSMSRGKIDKRELQQERMKEYRSLFK